MLFQAEGTTWSNSGLSGVSRWMGYGVEGNEVGETSGRIMRWPCVSTGACSGPHATSFEPTLDAGTPIWSCIGQVFLSSGSQASAEENGWCSLCNCSWTCWDFLLETEQMLRLIHDLGWLVTSLVPAPGSTADAFLEESKPKVPVCCWFTLLPSLDCLCTGARLQIYMHCSFAQLMWRLCQLVRSLDFLS